MRLTLALLLGITLLSVPASAAKQDPVSTIPNALRDNRLIFVLQIVAALTDAQLKALSENPAFQVEPVDGALAFPDTTIGLITSPLCDDNNIRQLLGGTLNEGQGKVLTQRLGFNQIVCRGEKAYQVYPARRK